MIEFGGSSSYKSKVKSYKQIRDEKAKLINSYKKGDKLKKINEELKAKEEQEAEVFLEKNIFEK